MSACVCENDEPESDDMLVGGAREGSAGLGQWQGSQRASQGAYVQTKHATNSPTNLLGHTHSHTHTHTQPHTHTHTLSLSHTHARTHTHTHTDIHTHTGTHTRPLQVLPAFARHILPPLVAAAQRPPPAALDSDGGSCWAREAAWLVDKVLLLAPDELPRVSGPPLMLISILFYRFYSFTRARRAAQGERPIRADLLFMALLLWLSLLLWFLWHRF